MASPTGYVHEFEERGGEFRIRVKGGERSGLPEKKKKGKEKWRWKGFSEIFNLLSMLDSLCLWINSLGILL